MSVEVGFVGGDQVHPGRSRLVQICRGQFRLVEVCSSWPRSVQAGQGWFRLVEVVQADGGPFNQGRFRLLEVGSIKVCSRDGPGASGYPLTFSAKSDIRIRWRVSARISADIRPLNDP
jgi:hypothetical protein